MSIYDHLRDYLGLQFSEGPAGSYMYKNRLIQGSLDPAAGTARDPAQELQAQILDYLDQLAAGYRHMERDWDVHYSQAMQTRMGTSRRVIGEVVSPMAYGQYDILRGYGIRDKDSALEVLDIGRAYAAMPGYVETSPGIFAAASKVKRTQLQAQFGVHLARRERQPSPIRMAGAAAPEQGYRLDTAVVWSGAFAPDQGYMRPGAFQPYGVKSGSFYVNSEHMDDLELAGTGNLYRRGGEIPIASVGGHTYRVPVKSWEKGASSTPSWMRDILKRT